MWESLLSAACLCVSQSTKGMKQRFVFIINQLRSAELPAFQSSLMALLNCLLKVEKDQDERLNIHDELLGKEEAWKEHNMSMLFLSLA